jgi:hypothetical protein
MNSKNKKWQRFWQILVVAVVSFSLVRIYFNATDDFRLTNITYELPYHPEWDIIVTPEDNLQLKNLLKQKFSYVAKGSQSYVFESADQQYVLKFFKFKHLKPSWLVSYLPPISPFAYYQQKELARKQRKLYEVFSGYKLAYELLRDESGLFYIHLNPKRSDPAKMVTVVDKMGLEREIDLSQVVYVIQEKGRTLRSVLAQSLDKKDIEGTRKRIAQIFDLYSTEYNRGVYDHDHGVMRNMGFAGDKPLHLDLGKLMREERMKEPHVRHEDLKKVVASIKEWLQIHYPQYQEPLFTYMDQRLAEFDDTPISKK